MNASVRRHWLKILAPLLPTIFVIIWTLAVQSFTRYGDNWALYPVLLAVPVALLAHIFLVVTLRPRAAFVGYAIVHLAALFPIVMISLMRISKDSL